MAEDLGQRFEMRNGKPESVVWWKTRITEAVNERENGGIAKLAQEREELEYLSLRDQMTGALNREAILMVAEKNKFLEMSHPGHGVGVAFLDLDNFGSKVARAGGDKLTRLERDERADRAIVEFAKLLQKIGDEEFVKTGDLSWKGVDVGRLGGEEFALVETDVDEKKWGEMLGVVRSRVEQELATRAGIVDLVASQTVSIGGVVMREGTVSDALTRADEALLRAKEKGKNRVEISEGVEVGGGTNRTRQGGAENRGNIREERKAQLQKEMEDKLLSLEGDAAGREKYIGELAALMDRLDQDRMSDVLTGLLQRGSGSRMLNEVLTHTLGNKEQTRLVLLDISKFKVINDTYGHDQGDAVLRGVARAINELVVSEKWEDGFGVRWRPGGQFLLVIPHASRIDLPKGDIGRKIRQMVGVSYPDVNLDYIEVDADGSRPIREVTTDLDIGLERKKQERL
jgi:diguanylate cyclase (GGDEF)-like protein